MTTQPETAAAPGATLTDAGPHWTCCWDDCRKQAVAAVTFRDRPGHVHDCAQHVAVLREWSDVTAVVPLPCLLPHGTAWTAQPRDLT
jgi:uncharacterized protein (DUF362 family)